MTVGVHHAGRIGSIGHDDQVVEGRPGRPGPLDDPVGCDPAVHPVGDERPRTGGGEQVVDLPRPRPRPDPHRHGAGPLGAEKSRMHVGAVGQEHADALAGRHATSGERGGHDVAPIVVLRPAHTAVLRDEGGGARPGGGALTDHVAQGATTPVAGLDVGVGHRGIDDGAHRAANRLTISNFWILPDGVIGSWSRISRRSGSL